jgi:hypothetical protein
MELKRPTEHQLKLVLSNTGEMCRWLNENSEMVIHHDTILDRMLVMWDWGELDEKGVMHVKVDVSAINGFMLISDKIKANLGDKVTLDAYHFVKLSDRKKYLEDAMEWFVRFRDADVKRIADKVRSDAERTDIGIETLRAFGERLERWINAVPSGDFRNTLTDLNIMLGTTITALDERNELKETKPKTIDVWLYEDDGESHMASFAYYDGIRVAKLMKLKQTTELELVRKGTHFIVMCGDVVIRITANEYPEIERIAHND